MSNKFRSVKWLVNNNYAPQVYLFRNIESGQVAYSQLPHINTYQLKTQWWRPNWENRKPSKRRDIWRVMAVATFEDHEKALKAYNALVELRYMREVTKRKEAESLRKRNSDGNIWYYAQYRPTYSMESVADLSEVIDQFKFKTKIHWEDIWRKGEDKHWSAELAEHIELPKFNPRERFAVLDQLREETLREAKETKEIV
ncbi:unnamed protein product [Kuraishia capsulata CBS 1993]|uniref:Large ribosomal subunit protein mL67 n=1 Tax=Kuraishia capsulata CBS 1993 TaxID=1382522 RepID=W6MNW0_9ASCO|nr:uncharacterized protein KUCA_T00004341001 [Kuraishia capsulata CBS 1993]CDK28359.1 unnamed protein product [Kuraishia capsulata CBS 1993]